MCLLQIWKKVSNSGLSSKTDLVGFQFFLPDDKFSIKKLFSCHHQVLFNISVLAEPIIRKWARNKSPQDTLICTNQSLWVFWHTPKVLVLFMSRVKKNNSKASHRNCKDCHSLGGWVVTLWGDGRCRVISGIFIVTAPLYFLLHIQGFFF